MGHIVNPIAYRLGHTRSWEDNWYIKNIYYPEFLHSLFKIRHYLHFFWTTKHMEKKGFIFSHLYIYKFIKTFLIKIFLYNIDYEKHVYSFYAKGTSTFSDAFRLRLILKKKRKNFFFFERYKPDLFFLFFLYHTFFLFKKKVWYKKNKKNINFLQKKKENRLNNLYLDALKNSNISFFNKTWKKDEINNKFLKIDKYENKIRKITNKKINMGFFDFLLYTFLKVNMLDKPKEMKKKIKKRYYEHILNYPIKIKKWIYLLKLYVNVKTQFLSKFKKSVKNFIFFLTFILNCIKKYKNKVGRKLFRLRDLNLNLVRVIYFNKILTRLGFFYGKYLRLIIYILSKINKSIFKFCFINHNSINAKFLARYIGLKLKKKFPLFSVINPVKRELRKLYRRKKEKKTNLLKTLFDFKFDFNDISLNYKDSFKFIIGFFSFKFLEFYNYYYSKYKTLITFDYLISFLYIKKKLNNQKLNKYFKKKFIEYTNLMKFKYKKNYVKLNEKWNFFIRLIFKKMKKYDVIKLLSFINMFLKNKLLINLFFSINKYNLDNLSSILFLLKFDVNSFFFMNKNFLFLLVYNNFFNYTNLNTNTLLFIEPKYNLISDYFFKTFLYYMYSYYSFNSFIDEFNINKKKYYKKTKELYNPTSFILGFKMSFKGRFTRKQRASSIWFHQGVVPLNTIKGIVDYAFFTVPLKNSAVSIKLWLYKKTNKMLWHNRTLNIKNKKIKRLKKPKKYETTT